MKKILKIVGITLGVICLVGIIIGICVYNFVLQYPELNYEPTVNKWYRVSDEEMKDSEGNKYHALFKKGSENKVMVYFAGGGVSINEDTAKYDTYNTKLVKPDALANLTMNMGGLASDGEELPFNNWTKILFPYATGDFHIGTGEYKYIDKDGKEKTLYHNGYNNYKLAMDKILEKADIENASTVLVTGYSAGGWGASMLANNIFTNYFPNSESKTVLVDSSVALYDDWFNVATSVWNAPKEITNRIKTNNITLDSLTALYEDFGDNVNILFNSSTRDGDLAKIQRYFDDLVIDENGEIPVEDKDGDYFELVLKDFVIKLKEQANASIFLYNDFDYYGRDINLTSHTIISTPYVWEKLGDTGKSISEWLLDAINGNTNDYGLNLLNN